MNISPNNEKIQKYLDELSEEYKELLFKALLERSKSIDDISASDLLRLDSEIKKPLIENNQRQKKKRTTLLLSGLLYIFLSIFMLIMYYTIKSAIFRGGDGIFLLTSVVIGIVGLYVSVLSFILPFRKANVSKYKGTSQPDTMKLLSFEVIAKWRELESIVNDMAENNSVLAPRSIIDYLLSNNFIDKDESIILREFLKMRNNIVHSSKDDLSSDDIKLALTKVDKIIVKLRKIL